MKKSLLGSVALLISCLTGTTLAQDIPDAIISHEGIGFSRMDEGAVVAYDLVSAYDEHVVLEADCGTFKAEAKGVSWCFANAQNQATFEAATTANGNNPYLPFVGGHCGLGMANGNLVAKGDPRTAVRIGDHLVLNGRFVVRTRFLQDTERNVDNALLRYALAIEVGKLK